MNDEPSVIEVVCGMLTVFALLAILWTVAAIF